MIQCDRCRNTIELGHPVTVSAVVLHQPTLMADRCGPVEAPSLRDDGVRKRTAWAGHLCAACEPEIDAELSKFFQTHVAASQKSGIG